MTTARRQRKLQFWRLGTGLLFAWVLAAALGVAGPTRAATADRVVVDRNSGLAINGFDPVAYFTDAQALPGKDEFEQEVAGVVWRFKNGGNRAAFRANPDFYRLRYGGYDPVGIARGVAVAGNPRLWAISDQRLYFFYTEETRREFARDRDATISTADSEWPSVLRMVVPCGGNP